MQEPGVAGGTDDATDWRDLYRSERRKSDELQNQVSDLERSQVQLQSYAEDLRRMYAEQRRRVSSLNLLQEASTSITAALDQEIVLERILASLVRLVPNESAHVMLPDEVGQIRTRARGGETAAGGLPDSQQWDDSDTGRLLARVFHLEESEPPAIAVVTDLASLAVLLRTRGRAIGLLVLQRGEGQPFSSDEIRLVELVAAVAAVALENANLYQETQRLATVDPLTEVFNYRYFHNTLGLEVQRARRHGYALGVLMVDLDHFKRINDLHGHPKGDEVLREVARAAREQLRSTDVLARLGGEEFGVLLPGASPVAVAVVGQKLRAAVARIRIPSGQGDGLIRVTMSVGGVSLPSDHVEPTLLIHLADQALFRAKEAGRNRVVVERPEEVHAEAHRSAG